MYFALAQVLLALWAAWFAHYQEPILKAFITWVPGVNPYERKFHRRGFAASCFVALIIGLSFYVIARDRLESLLLIPSFIAIYEILFNGVIGLEIHKDFFYLGDTAKHDIWIKEKFPNRNAGKVKATICIAVFVLFNLLNYLLWPTF